MEQVTLFTPQVAKQSNDQQTGRTSEMVHVFDNPQFGKIRTAGTAEHPLFCLADVCKALGLQTGATKNRLNDRGISTINTPTENQHGTVVMQGMNYIDEPNLYKCIFQSRKESATAFQDWVTSEVLPSIRKTGSYSVQQRLPQTYAEALRELADKSEQNERLRLENDRMKSKEAIYDRVMQTPESAGLITTRQIAQEFGWSPSRLYKKLMEIGLLYEQSGMYMLYAPYNAWGLHGVAAVRYMCSDGNVQVKEYLKWTVRGKAFIIALYENDWSKRKANAALKRGSLVAVKDAVAPSSADPNDMLRRFVEQNNEQVAEIVKWGRERHGKDYGPFGDCQGVLPFSSEMTYEQNLHNIFTQIRYATSSAFDMAIRKLE